MNSYQNHQDSHYLEVNHLRHLRRTGFVGYELESYILSTNSKHHLPGSSEHKSEKNSILLTGSGLEDLLLTVPKDLLSAYDS